MSHQKQQTLISTAIIAGVIDITKGVVNNLDGAGLEILNAGGERMPPEQLTSLISDATRAAVSNKCSVPG